MTQKREQGAVYKHAEFIRSKGFQYNPDSGFFVMPDLILEEYEEFRTNFRSDFTSVMLVKKGKLKGTLDRKVYTCVTNDLILISPHVLKKTDYVDKDSTVAVLNFTVDFLVDIGIPANKLELYDFFTSKYSPVWQLSAADAGMLSDYFTQLHVRYQQVMDGAPFAKELLQHTFLVMWYELAAMSTRYLSVQTPNITRKESLVISFTNLVQLQFRYQRNVQQYAEQLFVTAKHLTETVKEITGKNAGEIIDDIVIMEAKMLLEDSRLSISEIAELLHFSDQSFFGKFFKRHAGVSPRTFRAMIP
ncbi:AraC family transcriptional regulator [Chitinophaga solisilvae]|uniref:AraC family transcriptional regulator n=1 Tax=Chitinophaga solisilvae TaxID=1233460 RepID=A0A3S1DTI1_9BACT|nr:helix-turn-helix domain-containing protein [Chitinophaga solisilvae]NSL90961.1 AraC family transcriptional regulator [Chitinophaga solisilvae]